MPGRFGSRLELGHYYLPTSGVWKSLRPAIRFCLVLFGLPVAAYGVHHSAVACLTGHAPAWLEVVAVSALCFVVAS